jgi:hypothetical protein
MEAVMMAKQLLRLVAAEFHHVAAADTLLQ